VARSLLSGTATRTLPVQQALRRTACPNA